MAHRRGFHGRGSRIPRALPKAWLQRASPGDAYLSPYGEHGLSLATMEVEDGKCSVRGRPWQAGLNSACTAGPGFPKPLMTRPENTPLQNCKTAALALDMRAPGVIGQADKCALGERPIGEWRQYPREAFGTPGSPGTTDNGPAPPRRKPCRWSHCRILL